MSVAFLDEGTFQDGGNEAWFEAWFEVWLLIKGASDRFRTFLVRGG